MPVLSIIGLVFTILKIVISLIQLYRQYQAGHISHEEFTVKSAALQVQAERALEDTRELERKYTRDIQAP